MGKQDHRGSLIHPPSHTAGAWIPDLEKKAHFQVFYMQRTSRGTWAKLRRQDVCSVADRSLIPHSPLSSCVTLNKTMDFSEPFLGDNSSYRPEL